MQRAVVGVADRERVGQGIVERDVPSRQVRHRRAALVRDPLVVLAAVPGRVRVRPPVRRVFEELEPEIRGRSG